MEADALIDLINKGIVKSGTEVTVIRRGQDLGGQQIPIKENLEVITYTNDNDEIILEAQNNTDGKKYKIRAANILRIDGMHLSRLTLAHQSEGKKRGRKPKKRKKGIG